MPTERRNLRSSKNDNSSSTEGDKSKSNSSNSTTKKEKPAPVRTTSTRSRSTSKKASSGPNKEIGGDKSDLNGTTSSQEKADVIEDVEMSNDKPTDKKSVKSGKEGDEEMTVVVPPAKSSKKPTNSSGKEDVDTTMNGTAEDDTQTSEEPELDPKEKAITGILCFFPEIHYH